VQSVVKRIAVAGYGAVGRALAERLAARGDDVRIIQRQFPPALPPGVAFVCANLEDAVEAQSALANVDIVVWAVGIPYRSRFVLVAPPITSRRWLERFGGSSGLSLCGLRFGEEDTVRITIFPAHVDADVTLAIQRVSDHRLGKCHPIPR
jgi:hypothetical protein